MHLERLADADRLTALLRTIAVPVLLIGETHIPRAESTESEFLVALAVFAVYALATLVGVRWIGSARRVWAGLLAADVLFAGLLSYTSGGGYSQLRFVFLLPMVTAAFRRIPAVTGLVVAASIVVYVVQAWPHPTRAHHNGGLSFIVVQTLNLAWIGAGMTSLSWLLARREASIRKLSEHRQRLVAEALTAEERERKQLAEDLHDGPIQNLLAARHTLTAGATGDPQGTEAQAHAAITRTLTELRSAVIDLHPYLLEQAGVGAAISQVARSAAERAGFALDLDLDLDARTAGVHDRALLRCASELLANVVRHARATRVRVTLTHDERYETLSVSDNGVGCDPRVLAELARPGHIGLLSLSERADALGGSFDLRPAAGGGTTAEVTLPRFSVRGVGRAR
jgi:two-component system NarL family sensor kinase